MNSFRIASSLLSITLALALGCSKSEPSASNQAPATKAAAASEAKTAKQLLPGTWRTTKAIYDGKDLTKEMGSSATTTFTDSAMTQKIGSHDVTSPYTVTKDSAKSLVIKDNKGEESTITFDDDKHMSLESIDQRGSKVMMSYEKI